MGFIHCPGRRRIKLWYANVISAITIHEGGKGGEGVAAIGSGDGVGREERGGEEGVLPPEEEVVVVVIMEGGSAMVGVGEKQCLPEPPAEERRGEEGAVKRRVAVPPPRAPRRLLPLTLPLPLPPPLGLRLAVGVPCGSACSTGCDEWDTWGREGTEERCGEERQGEAVLACRCASMRLALEKVGLHRLSGRWCRSFIGRPAAGGGDNAGGVGSGGGGGGGAGIREDGGAVRSSGGCERRRSSGEEGTSGDEGDALASGVLGSSLVVASGMAHRSSSGLRSGKRCTSGWALSSARGTGEAGKRGGGGPPISKAMRREGTAVGLPVSSACGLFFPLDVFCRRPSFRPPSSSVCSSGGEEARGKVVLRRSGCGNEGLVMER